MSYFEEMSYCPVQEFEAWEPLRIHEGDLVINEPYMIMMLLAKQIHGQQAMKAPILVKGIDARLRKKRLIQFTFNVLGIEHTPVFGRMNNGHMKGGFRSSGGGSVTFFDAGVQLAYIRGASDLPLGPDDERRRKLEYTGGFPEAKTVPAQIAVNA